MTVLSISRNFNEAAQIVNMEVDVSLATVATTGWLALPAVVSQIESLNSGLWVWQPSDLVWCWSTLDVNGALFKVNLTTNSLTLYSTAGSGGVTLPVVSNDFVNFDGILGQLKDSGYSPSDPAKTKVVMAGSAVVTTRIAKFVDVAGTIDDTAGNAVNIGDIIAGVSGTPGKFISFPPTGANGSLILAAVDAGANFNTTISNGVMGQSSVISIPDPGVASSSFLLADSATTQTITSGNLSLTLGNLTVSVGTIQALANNITAGSAGNAGWFISFPPTLGNGSLVWRAVDSGGAFTTTVSNGVMGQSSTITIPDPGVASSSFVLTDSAGTQVIATGNLTLSVGNFIASAGDIQAGSAGNPGMLVSFPLTAGNGSLRLASVDAGGAFNTTISNGVMAQSSVYTIPDVVNAVGRFLVGATAAPFVGGNFPIASGTGGLMVDSGVPAANLQNKTNIIAAQSANIGGAGAGPLNIVNASVAAASVIVASIISSSNPCSIIAVAPGVGSFNVTVSADPGANLFISYVIFVAPQ